MDPLPDRIEVRGRWFDLVCVRRSEVGVYRGEDAYLRIGPATVPEVALQRRLLADGFPVAEILEVGDHAGSPYFIEASLGPDTWGDVHQGRIEAGHRVSDEEFWELGEVMLQWAGAQLHGVRRPWQSRDFAGFLGVTRAVDNVPALAAPMSAAFERVATVLRDLPGAWQHDDLHAFNACRGGVIDLEGVGWAVAGYDVATAVLEPSLAEARWEDDLLSLAWFTEDQVGDYLQRLDEEFLRASAPPPSTLIDAYLVGRAISTCSRIPRDEAVWTRRQDTLERLLTSFLEAGRLPLGISL
jgi:hypothetical protein